MLAMSRGFSSAGEQPGDDRLILREAQHRIAEGAADGEIVEVGDDGGALRLLAAPPGGDIRQAQILAQELAAELRHEAHHRRRFEHAGAKRIGERDAALADGLDEAGDAKPRMRVEFERIGEIAVDAPPDHVGALEAGDGAHMHLALAHGEIAALDQNEAEIAGEIGLFEIGFVKRARRPQADARIGAVGERGEAGAERLEERREPLDVHVAIERREGAREHQPVGQRIAGAGGRLGAIADAPTSARPGRGRGRRRRSAGTCRRGGVTPCSGCRKSAEPVTAAAGRSPAAISAPSP